MELQQDAARARVFDVQLFVERKQLKAVAEFRRQVFSAASCRFCFAPLPEDRGVISILDSLAECCGSADCTELAHLLCNKPLPCGHRCCGVRGETECLPCLQQCQQGCPPVPLKQVALFVEKKKRKKEKEKKKKKDDEDSNFNFLSFFSFFFFIFFFPGCVAGQGQRVHDLFYWHSPRGTLCAHGLRPCVPLSLSSPPIHRKIRARDKWGEERKNIKKNPTQEEEEEEGRGQAK